MSRSLKYLPLLLAASVLTSCVGPRAPERAPVPPLSFLRVEGMRTLDERGQDVILKGCNIGNWFLLEMWMLDALSEVHDQHTFEGVLEERFGREKKDGLMELYRAHWVTDRDFAIIRSFGFNVVRLPFHYSLLMDEDRPYVLREDGMRWLEKAVGMAARRGLYTILDLHGTPGGQSVDHTTGREKQNRLWTDAECQRQTIWLWEQVAARFRDEPAVAAYDLINEPFGDYKTDDHEPVLADLMGRMYTAIRALDPQHVIVVAGARSGLGFYGDPRARGWTNIVYSEHYYPGIFNGNPSLEPHRHFINRTLPAVEHQLRTWDVPQLVGEFNVVFRAAGGTTLMRWYYDRFAKSGWWATMWSYKTISRRGGLGTDPWYMVTNLDPSPPFSVRNSSPEEIEAWCRWLGAMDYAVYDGLREALTTPAPAQLYVEDPPVPMTPPCEDSAGDWEATDVSSLPAGGQCVVSDAGMDIYGGGRDLWNDHDEFRFVSQAVGGDFRLRATVEGLDDVNPCAKAGIMVRGSLDDNAAHVLLHVFPSGQIAVGWRDQPGAMMQERKFPVREFPVRLLFEREGGQLRAAFSLDGANWESAGSFDFDWLGTGVRAGMAVLSHDNRYLARGRFRDIQLNQEKE